MRIGFLTHQWPGVRMGGIGGYTYECARALVVAGHEAHVFTLTLPADIRAKIPAGVVVHEVADLAGRVDAGRLPGALAAGVQAGGEGAYRLALAWLLCEAVRAEHKLRPLDLVEGPEYEALGLPLLLNPVVEGGGGGGLAVVTQIHSGSVIGREGNGGMATPETLLFEALELAAIAAADGVCAPSRQVVADMRRLMGIGDGQWGEVAVLALPFRVPGEGRDVFGDPTVKHAQRPPRPCPTGHGTPSGHSDGNEGGYREPPVGGAVLYIGRLERIKGAEVLAGALGRFLERCPEARVKLAGPDTATAPGGSGGGGGGAGGGSMAAWMRGQWSEEVGKRVEFLGEVTKEEIGKLLGGAAFCVVPSLFDSYSLVCCEALAAGRAVVVSDGIGATEVVGDAGVTFERGNAGALAEVMEGFWRDRGRVVALGQRAYRRARTVLANEVTLPGRIAFYRRTIEKVRGGGRKPWSEGLATLPAGYGAALIGALVGLTGGLCGVVNSERPTPGGRLVKLLDEMAGGAGMQVYLYGAGRHTTRLLAEKYLWEQRGHQVVGLIDDHPRFKEAGEFAGLPVVSREIFEGRVRAGEIKGAGVVLSTDTFQEQFWEQTVGMRGMGVRVWRLYE